jgi:hypothetical protein
LIFYAFRAHLSEVVVSESAEFCSIEFKYASVFFGLLQSRGLALFQALWASIGFAGPVGLDFKNPVVDGWKSVSLTIVGVMKIRRLSF